MIVVATITIVTAATPFGAALLLSFTGLLHRALGQGVAGGAALAMAAIGAIILVRLVLDRRRRKRDSAIVHRALRAQSMQPVRATDPLSRIRGRGAFVSVLEDRLQGHLEEGRQLAVHRLDIDRFRDINQAFGNDAGDVVLIEVTRRLGELAGDVEHLARLGDDEFAVIQPETSGARHAEIFAERLQKALDEPILVADLVIPVTVSIGIAVGPEHGSEAGRLLASADLALHPAKQAGRGGIRVFAPEMDDRLERRHYLEEAIRQSLQGEGFVLRYQPEYDLATRRLLGFEVQVWLEDPRLGTLEEREFGPVAQDLGLIPAIGERAVREACRTAGTWPQHLRLGFNLLPGHLDSGEFGRTLAHALKANRFSLDRVDVEVAEALISSGGQHVGEQLQRLAGMGFRLVLDHYGSVNGSPHDLWRHGFNAMKIDASLIRRLGTGEDVEPLVGAIIKLGQALGVQVIADGADDVEQVHFLMLKGCRNVVGPILGPAVTADKLAPVIGKDMQNATASGEAATQSPVAA